VIIGLFVFWQGRKELPARLLLLMTIFFSIWVFCDLVLWASEFPSYIMFYWALEDMVEPFVYFFAFYFFFAFVFKRDFSNLQKIIFSIPLYPTVLLAATRYMLLGFDLTNCDRAADEGIIATYGYGIEILYTILIIGFAIYAWIKIKERSQRIQIILLGVGICAFLLSFSLGNIVQVFTQNWSIDQFNLFGAPVFVAFLAYIIVRFKAFRAQLIAPQALVFGLAALVFSLLFITKIGNVRIITAITLVFVLILGYLLIRSVHREIEQREKIEKLADDLEKANKQQVVLLHFITHQIKGFLTKSRNTFSLALEGDLGPLPDAMRPIFQQAFDSDTQGVNTVQEILNAANVKSGAVTYMMEPFDLAKLVEEVANGLKPNADAKGLAFTVDIGEGAHTINGDHLQLQNAIKNLIDNSIKYTPSGSVTVSLKQEGNMLRFMIQDTGVGITAEDMAHLFTEGGHGKDSQKVNVESTGFGLYIVKNIAEAHHGKVWAESEGAGKGSKFILELPISDTSVAPAAA
jgi:signal transduction histidine kinase